MEQGQKTVRELGCGAVHDATRRQERRIRFVVVVWLLQSIGPYYRLKNIIHLVL